MKLLLIPDVHGRPFWKNAVEKHISDVDKIIFLGDYLDPYPDEGHTRKEAIACLEEIIKLKQDNVERVVLLLGNHCMPYFDKHFDTRSRFDSSNARKISEIYNSHRSFFKLAHEETINDRHFLFSHAGLMKSWYERNKNTIGDLTVDGINHLLVNPVGVMTLTDLSHYRTWLGEKTGSIVWSDVRERIDYPEDAFVEGFDFQIFGHTQLSKDPLLSKTWACIDCRHAFILNDDFTLEMVNNVDEEDGDKKVWNLFEYETKLEMQK